MSLLRRRLKKMLMAHCHRALSEDPLLKSSYLIENEKQNHNII
jgi:hypothetical protein